MSTLETSSPNCWLPRLRRKASCDYLLSRHGVEIAPATLAKLAVTGGGPQFESWGRIPYYLTECLDEWALGRLRRRRSTSDIDLIVDRQKEIGQTREPIPKKIDPPAPPLSPNALADSDPDRGPNQNGKFSSDAKSRRARGKAEEVASGGSD